MGPVSCRGVTAKLRATSHSKSPAPALYPETPPQAPFIIGGDSSAVMMVSLDCVFPEHHRHWIVDMSGRNVSVRVHALQSLNQSLFKCVAHHVFQLDTVGSLCKLGGRQPSADGRGPRGSAWLDDPPPSSSPLAPLWACARRVRWSKSGEVQGETLEIGERAVVEGAFVSSPQDHAGCIAASSASSTKARRPCHIVGSRS